MDNMIIIPDTSKLKKQSYTLYLSSGAEIVVSRELLIEIMDYQKENIPESWTGNKTFSCNFYNETGELSLSIVFNNIIAIK